MSNEAILGLAGILATLTATITTATVHLLLERFRHVSKVSDKIIDARIATYEDLSKLVDSLRVLLFHHGIKGDNDWYLAFFHDKDRYFEMVSEWESYSLITSIWIPDQLRFELSCFSSYLINIRPLVDRCNDETLRKLGNYLMDDFRSFAEAFEKSIVEFYTEDIYKVRSTSFGQKIQHTDVEIKKRIGESKFGQITRLEDIIKN